MPHEPFADDREESFGKRQSILSHNRGRRPSDLCQQESCRASLVELNSWITKSSCSNRLARTIVILFLATLDTGLSFCLPFSQDESLQSGSLLNITGGYLVAVMYDKGSYHT